MNTIIEKIRAEVNRLKKEQPARNAIGAICGEETVVDASKLNTFLSDLEKEEKPTTAEGLEEEIERMYLKDTLTLRTRAQYADLARHFAQWQKEQMKRFVEENIGRVSILFADAVARDAIDHEFRKCDFKNGAEWVIGKVTIEEVTK